jgi:hypothetical protein
MSARGLSTRDIDAAFTEASGTGFLSKREVRENDLPQAKADVQSSYDSADHEVPMIAWLPDSFTWVRHQPPTTFNVARVHAWEHPRI